MRLKHAGLASALAICAALPAFAQQSFNRIASFATPLNMVAGEDTARPSSAEIIAASEDGNTLIYTDSPLGVVGLIDITDPAAPKPLGNIDVGGEPTTAKILGGKAFAAVVTSESKANPSGKVVTVDLATRAIVADCDLGGQPDSVAMAKDGSFLAVAIENERDEEVNDGAIPQLPAGFVVKLPLVDGAVNCAGLQRIEVTGLAEVAPEDPEPEFVSVNDAGEIAVTLQENNHIVVIGADGTIASHFSAGAVDLDGIDVKRDGRLRFDGAKTGVLREPDGLVWLDNDLFAVANEGDYEGGSRSWTIFRKDGTVVHDSGAGLERAIAEIGHYPEHRSRSKGTELESVEFAVFGGTPMAFVASERGSVIGVYDLTDPAAPVLKQLLPSGISPEGMVPIPSRGLLVSANEVDLVEDGLARAHVMIFQRQDAPAAYPMITSAGTEDLIGWGALSGLAADPAEPGRLYAVSDSVYAAAPTIYTIDASQTPARITSALPVTRGGDAAQKLDLEGIVADGEGGFWLASEGRSDRLVPHAIYHVDAEGAIDREIALPPELLANETRFGFEGITVAGKTLWMAVQREWKDDPKGMVKLLAYDTEAETWGAVHYPLDTAGGDAWIGLSEITLKGDWIYIVERDNQVSETALVKKLYRVPTAQMQPASLGGPLPVVTKELVRDLLPDLAVLKGYAMDKIEGFAIDAAGTGFVVTDNDGVDDSSGETLFWSLGAVQ
ncbi:MAG: esterase-like activity of phytase family protein [Rhodobacter sp.]|nr:esterase-like activity of phytase family protein [Rhodobacter sp.]MCA3455276.1 esterase-like activity of phytase family protein [Rhodobacter sp.]MCA3458870.1 esterase-like activity of phytase family protein [Rhodobacter sp.]MCA3459965.1 esterase-like activity of phytase family protein [Rhodobacter sp.]MCA3465524.1 esterase-like activity of phytase family protein [Rhodobacter sp.]